MFSHPKHFAGRWGERLGEADPGYEDTLDGWPVSALRKAAAAVVQKWQAPNSKYANWLVSHAKSRQA